jgi:N-acetylmuramoyl-L-alanine amidase
MSDAPQYAIVHCSDSPYGSASLIDQWHRDRGFTRTIAGPGELRHIGYQYVVGNGRRTNSRDYVQRDDGLIEIGRRETETGAHAQGWNTRSVGVCLIGRGEYTPAQMAALKGLLLGIMVRWQIPVDHVLGHCEIDSKKGCPLLDMSDLRHDLARLKAAL